MTFGAFPILSTLEMVQAPLAPSVATSANYAAVPEALEAVRQRIRSAASGRTVQLVAVSKMKSAESVQAARDAGQAVFGESYVQELLAKALQVPQDVRWHFIGRLQSNKVKTLVESLPNLAAIETVTSTALADRIARVAAAVGRGSASTHTPALDVYVQVDTSGEATKNGVKPEETPALAEHIVTACGPSLRLAGLMTIGAPDDASCFDALVAARDAVTQRLALPAERIGLSMGMSGDFEEAIRRGSTSVRVGSSIFGARPTKGMSD